MAYQDPFAARPRAAEHDNERNQRSNAGVISKRGREPNYIPYQDALYYQDQSSSSDYPDHDSRDRRRDDLEYRRTNETFQGRRYKSDAGPVSRPRGEQNYEEQGPYPKRSPHYPDLDYQGNRRRRRGDSSNSSASQIQHRPRSRSRSRSRNQDSRSRDSRDSRDYSSHCSRSRSSRSQRPQPDPKTDPRKPSESYTILKALKSAAMAGGVEAVRCRAEPGPWSGQKGKRIAVAAATGTAIGALRNGRLAASGKMPYADAAMTGFYAIDFLKRVARHTEHGKNSLKEQRDWYDDRDWDEEARDRWGQSTNDRMRSKKRQDAGSDNQSRSS
ncbi:hypothetical protein DOTSEDRAFT_39647 [Dothistroma septosporum NZE10]|uniref:Uncharacterized protein n=1 Tax=Dothistroma septosporum (strain NZE10 / CBS 128990) TaxID=675120 RepID=M2WHN4_DOTSN|nr:hypothetical protein DOTSEDRAFT_39647 [Dothistroma septosporum NZE10]